MVSAIAWFHFFFFFHLHSPSYLHLRDCYFFFFSFIGLGRARVLFVGFLRLHTPKAFYRYSRPRTAVFPLLHHVSTPTARVVVFHASLILYTYIPIYTCLLTPTPISPSSHLRTLSFVAPFHHFFLSFLPLQPQHHSC
ncbi:hypothetical protein BDV11DRAFT_63352 [Aspergillus similis]